MKKNVYRYNWNDFTLEEAVRIFRKELGAPDYPLASGSYLTCLPNYEIFTALRHLERALLECLENRTSSTIFRIKEVATVYQVFLDGRTKQFSDYEEYSLAPVEDQLLVQYDFPIIAYSVSPLGDGYYQVKRNKAPRFVGHYKQISGTLECVTDQESLVIDEWLDPEPDPIKKKQVFQKLHLFISKYVK